MSVASTFLFSFCYREVFSQKGFYVETNLKLPIHLKPFTRIFRSCESVTVWVRVCVWKRGRESECACVFAFQKILTIVMSSGINIWLSCFLENKQEGVYPDRAKN